MNSSTQKDDLIHDSIPLRPAEAVMRLHRMGCFHQTRLSFMRSLLRFLKQQNWSFERTLWQVDDKGVGTALYTASGPTHTYTLIAYANDLPDELRSDRVIATQWDASFTLFDGIPTNEDIERLRHNVPKQEAGRCTQSELVLARANRSVRLFEHVVDRLSKGEQPDLDRIEQVGYLMRTTAVYGNGKFGISDRDRIAHRPEFKAAFWAELLAVWLIRAFTVDIVEHLARVRGGEQAVKMDRDIRRSLGVGNSTGLGMAPFLITHSTLIHSWIHARETALARVRNLEDASAESQTQFSQLVSRMQTGVENWNTGNERQQQRIEGLKNDLEQLKRHIDTAALQRDHPWNNLVLWSEQNLTTEGQELVVTLVIEPHGWLVDDLSQTMSIDEAQYFPVDGSQTLSDFTHLVEKIYPWALCIDFSEAKENARFWYYSEEKLEPRVGERYDEPGAEKEYPLAYGRDICALYDDLCNNLCNDPHNDPHEDETEQTLAAFLVKHPEHRHSARRVQTTARLPYSEIQDNLISAEMMPVDLLRCKLSFFGANKFDPRSDRWVRINMYQYAPFPDEFYHHQVDRWVYPPL